MLVIVTPGFPENEKDSTCLPAVQQFILSLKKIHPVNDIYILSFQYPFTAGQYLWHGVTVQSLGGKNGKGLSRILIWVKAYRALKKINTRQRIKGVLSLWLSECAMVGNVYCKVKSLPHYIWLHGQDARAGNKYVKWTNPVDRQLIAISEFIKEEFNRNYNLLPSIVAENGVEPEIFPALNTGKREIDLLGVGSLVSLKNYKTFIEIIAEAKKQKHSLVAVLIGAGSEERFLRKMATDYGVHENLNFKGSLPHTEVLHIMNNSKILLHPSDYEGNSTVMIEALCAGCRVVSKQSLNTGKVHNLFLAPSKDKMVEEIIQQLGKTVIPERVIFNEMDKTAAKILKLFI